MNRLDMIKDDLDKLFRLRDAVGKLFRLLSKPNDEDEILSVDDVDDMISVFNTENKTMFNPIDRMTIKNRLMEMKLMSLGKIADWDPKEVTTTLPVKQEIN
jgi:hypothetical protein